ncbi:hypothetical protein DFQ27_008831, partial [Actinomortierella ambigua]
MIAINTDVIVLILENVEDRGTLFSLLTVNSQLFPYACRALYKDPIRFFRKPHIVRGPQLKSLRSLFYLFLSLSPATDEATNLARDVLDIPRKHEPEAVHTMLDYLSFIQSVRWECILVYNEWEWRLAPLKAYAYKKGILCYTKLFQDTLTWSICGHRLGEIRELEIQPSALVRYVGMAPRLGHLRVVTVATQDSSCDDLTHTIYPDALRLIQALQKYHGMDRLLHLDFAHGGKYIQHDAVFRWDVEIAKQLQPLFPRDLIFSVLRPMDAYLSRLKSLQMGNAALDRWLDISKEYSGMSTGQILQRCRSLVKLEIDFNEGKVDDPNAFAWATDEARERAAGRLSAPAVLLEELNLRMEGPAVVSASRVLRDSMRGFSQSLVTLQVYLRSPQGGEEGGEGGGGERSEGEDLQQVPSHVEWEVMPRLQSLMLSSSIVEPLDYRLLQLCPNLLTLWISLNRRKDSRVAPPCWPRLDLPHLTDLSLSGQAIDLFDPESLNSMLKLRELNLDDDLEGLLIPWEAEGSTLSGDWKWDWNLPELEAAHLRMDLLQANFSFGVLRGCPKLRELTVECRGPRSKPPLPLQVLSVLTSPSEDIFPALQELQLIGRCNLQPDDLQALVGRALPSLLTLHMGTVSPSTTQQVVELARQHSSLDSVTLEDVLLDDVALEKLGLVQLFPYACRALYKDPLRFFRRPHIVRTPQLKSLRSLFDLFLSISPATDEATNLARDAYDIPLMHEPEAVHTMLDYLSFIQSVRWECILDYNDELWGSNLLREHAYTNGLPCANFFQDIMTWTVCGHRLGEIRELEIQPKGLGRFIEMAPRLCRLRVVTIATQDSSCDDLTDTIYPDTLRFIQALQKYHGTDRLLYLDFAHGRKYNLHDDVFRWNVEIAKQLQPLFPRDLVFPVLRPMDAYLSRLKSLQMGAKALSRWLDISKDYSDMSTGQILQRCRSLVELEIDFNEGKIDDPNMFAWAADEARERAAGRLSAPAVPLEELHLQMEEPATVTFYSALRGSMRGFSQSLVKLHVYLTSLQVGEGREAGGGGERSEGEDLQYLPVRYDEWEVMPRLKSLTLSSSIVEPLDYRLLQLYPNLKALRISLTRRKDSKVAPPCWPRIDLPHLAELSLYGQAIDLFDPESLHSMLKLRELHLRGDHDLERQLLTLQAKECPPSGDVSADISGHWTWDWNLPELEAAHLRMDLSQAKFSFGVLRGCPKLRELNVECTGPRSKPPLPLHVLSVLTNPSEDIFPALQGLLLRGRYNLQPEDLQALVGRALPSLRTLYMDTVSPSTTQQVVELARQHSTLNGVTLLRSMPLDEAELKKL